MIRLLELPIKNYVVVGSRALNTRLASDIDVICRKEDVEEPLLASDEYIGHFYHQGIKVECLFSDKQESLQIILDSDVGPRIADDVELFILKAGHIYNPTRKWNKHIQDYAVLHKIIRNKYLPTSILPRLGRSLNDMIKLHRKCTKDRVEVRKTPKLKGTGKEAFFNDKVVKFIDHDEIHKWFAHKELPMYTYMQKEGADVECDPNLWYGFTFNEKIQCVLEEAYVIASERILIPKLMKPLPTGNYVHAKPYDSEDVKFAVHWAIMRISTTLCSGWFRKFAVDNHFEIMNSIDYNYHLKIQVDKLDANYGVQDRM